MKNLICFALSFASLIAVASATVSNVKARQRYPWNGKVDIECTLTGEAGQSYDLKVSVRDKMGGTNLNVTAVSVDGGSVTNNPVPVTSGVCRLIWDAEKDLPNGFRGEKVSISVTVTDNAKKFMIVDLESGAITYQSAAPEGGWTNEMYTTTKMVLQRFAPQTFWQKISGLYGRYVTITKPFYGTVSDVTITQLYKIAGSQSAVDAIYTKNAYASSNPSASAVRKYLRTNSSSSTDGWPASHSVSSDSPLGLLRSKTGELWDLPTEAMLQIVLDARQMDAYAQNKKYICLDLYTATPPQATTVDPVGPLVADKDYYGNWSYLMRDKAGARTYSSYVDATGGYIVLCLYGAE